MFAEEGWTMFVYHVSERGVCIVLFMSLGGPGLLHWWV